jgi:hypothetical protein
VSEEAALVALSAILRIAIWRSRDPIRRFDPRTGFGMTSGRPDSSILAAANMD